MAGGWFAGRTVLITGASSGIGAALAREFASRGAHVVLAARRLELTRELAADIRAAGGEASALACDVTRADSVAALYASLEGEGRSVDIVVANAGFGVSGRFQDLTVDDYRRQFETNVYGVLRTVYGALPALRRSRGQIVLIGSVAGHVPSPRSSAYSMSKFAVRALAQGLKADLRDDGIGVTLISPGFVDSDIRRTGNDGRVEHDAPDPVPGWLRVRTEVAARAIVRAVYRRRREAVITVHGKLLVWIYRHFPWMLNPTLDQGKRIRTR